MPTKTGFVIMPFSPTKSEANWTEIYTEVFQPALTECGYTCSRAEVSTGNLITSIVEQLIEADIVLVDVTDRNANVFYELGVRHSLRRGTIIVSQGSDHVPSDLKGYWFLNYGLRPAVVKAFKADIKRVIEQFEKDPLKSDNPVSDFLDKAHRSSIRETNRDNLKKLGALITELSGNRLAMKQQIATGKQQLISSGCLLLLLQTMYLDVGPRLLAKAHELEYHLEVLRRGGNIPTSFLNSTLNELELFSGNISAIRNGVSKGEFSEPNTISTMTWAPLDDQPNRFGDWRDDICKPWDGQVNTSVLGYGSVPEGSTESQKPPGPNQTSEQQEVESDEQFYIDISYSGPAWRSCPSCGRSVQTFDNTCPECGTEWT